jgi:hypothetical protein
MESLAGPFAVACTTLALAGVRKLVDPASTRGALREMGLPWRGPVVFLIAAGEVFAGVAGIVVGTAWAAAAVAGWYLAFAVFVAVALRRATPLSSCGCIGRPDTPPTVAHLGYDIGAFLLAAAVAVDPAGPISDVLADQPWGGVPFLLWVGIGVYVSYLVLAVLPLTLAQLPARRSRVGAA